MTGRGSDSSFPQDVCCRWLFRYERNTLVLWMKHETPMDDSLISQQNPMVNGVESLVRSRNRASHILFPFCMFGSTSSATIASAKVDKAETVKCLSLKPH